MYEVMLPIKIAAYNALKYEKPISMQRSLQKQQPCNTKHADSAKNEHVQERIPTIIKLGISLIVLVYLSRACNFPLFDGGASLKSNAIFGNYYSLGLIAFIAFPFHIISLLNCPQHGLMRIIFEMSTYTIPIISTHYIEWPGIQKGLFLMIFLVYSMKVHSYLSETRTITRDFKSLSYFICSPRLIWRNHDESKDKDSHNYSASAMRNLTALFIYMYFMYGLIVKIQNLIENSNRSMSISAYLDLAIKLLLPVSALVTCAYFGLFDHLLNLSADCTHTSPQHRVFYGAWWGSADFGEFSRLWNIPTHQFLHEYVYKRCKKFGVSGYNSCVITFFISSLLHEIVVGISAGHFRGVMFTCQMMEIPLIAIARRLHLSKKGRRWIGVSILWFGMTTFPSIIMTAYVL